MKAVVWTRYGPPDVLQLQEVAKPVPKDNEVLVKVHAASVFAGDCELRGLKIPILFRLFLRMYIGLTRPKRVTILGQELAGEIEAVGKDVERFKEGDQIFAATGFRFGAYAEYQCLPEDGMVATKPTNMTYEEATVVPVGGSNALHFLRLANIKSGQRVLINGAGGGIGTMAIQLARSWGAEVIAVDSTEKLDMLRSIGADRVIDYTKEDFTKNGETYDVIFDVVGKSPFFRSIRSLNKHGTLLLANNGLVVPKFQGLWTSMTSSKRVISKMAGEKKEDLVFLKELIEAGKISAVIDRRYPLEQTAEAHRYVDTGRKKGNVVITVAE
jgi:2-desacetyl-2-hydroxyethyl bacteriochlorophyllide A dehydrogenase